MELVSMKCTLVRALLFLVMQGMCGIDGVDGATGVCGKNPWAMLDKLGPCAAAAQSKNVSVSRKCCDQVKVIDR
ncbi:hypothetical protein L484_010377 [Morus notabilis]|uniref:Bifunctional inhibitor/plant lipid transfer protein/seed storage helical domain-containing protein n=1 Tax=Morus notabilis TaxID=981085 RepID=W9SNQ2_9ROSA|nr:hypothetical protein L484_010377 [Morus notabilis]